MDRNKWRVRKIGKVWYLFPPNDDPVQASGSWTYCVTRLIQIQRRFSIQASTRWRNG